VFVETGTYLGEMINAQEGNFDRLLTVELDPELYRKAVRRFRRLAQVSVFQGDSSVELPKMVAAVNEPAIFWLDAHYSKASPPAVRLTHLSLRTRVGTAAPI